jgi:hypothetical protein
LLSLFFSQAHFQRSYQQPSLFVISELSHARGIAMLVSEL